MKCFGIVFKSKEVIEGIGGNLKKMVVGLVVFEEEGRGIERRGLERVLVVGGIKDMEGGRGGVGKNMRGVV